MEVASGHFVLNTFQMLPSRLKWCFGASTYYSLKIQVRAVLIFGTLTANLRYKVHSSHLQIYLHFLIFNLLWVVLKMLFSDFCLPFCQNCSLVINTAPNDQVLILELLFEVSDTASVTYSLQLAFRSAPSFLMDIP